MRRTSSLLLLIACTLAIGCGRGDGEPPDPTASSADPTPARTVNPGQHGPTAEGNFSIEGAFDVTGEYSVLYPFFEESQDECAELASADVGTYGLPLPTFHGERQFAWTAGLRRYDGPGTYDLRDLEAVKVSVRKTAKAEAVDYVSGTDATAKVSITKANGGTFEFKRLTTKGGGTISGKVTWTCTEGSEGSSE